VSGDIRHPIHERLSLFPGKLFEPVNFGATKTYFITHDGLRCFPFPTPPVPHRAQMQAIT
jgi:hypothetical protein